MKSEIANAIADSFITDGQYTGNIADLIGSLCITIERAAKHLGNADAATPMGAIEAHGAAIIKASENIAIAITDLASAIRERGE